MVKIKGKDKYSIDDLFSPKIQIFDDDYHNEESILDESEEANLVRKIRRRYTDPFQYDNALHIYEQYMERLVQKYGGYKRFAICSELGLIRDFIPPLPRMKNSKKNKILEKYGIVFRNKIVTTEDMVDDLDNFLEENVSEEDMNNIYIKGAKSIKEKDIPDIVKQVDIVREKSIRRADSISYLEQYFYDLNKKTMAAKDKDKKAKKEDDNVIGISDYFNNNVIMKDELDPKEVIFYKGDWIAREDVEFHQLLETMGEGGFDSYKLFQLFSRKIKTKKTKGGLKNTRLLNAFKEKNKIEKKKKSAKDKLIVKLGDLSYEDFGF